MHTSEPPHAGAHTSEPHAVVHTSEIAKVLLGAQNRPQACIHEHASTSMHPRACIHVATCESHRGRQARVLLEVAEDELVLILVAISEGDLVACGYSGDAGDRSMCGSREELGSEWGCAEERAGRAWEHDRPLLDVHSAIEL